MKKFDVVIALEGIREARVKWTKAKREFDSGLNEMMRRLLHEAARNYLSVEEVAQSSGYSKLQVRAMMRLNGMDPRTGKRLLAESAAKALRENAELMGIEPGEMDLLSPLAYLPMGQQMRKEFLETKTVSQVTELPQDEGTPYAERLCRCKTPISSGTLNGGAEVCMWCSYILVKATE
jgi:hypothetical protein